MKPSQITPEILALTYVSTCPPASTGDAARIAISTSKSPFKAGTVGSVQWNAGFGAPGVTHSPDHEQDEQTTLQRVLARRNQRSYCGQCREIQCDYNVISRLSWGQADTGDAGDTLRVWATRWIEFSRSPRAFTPPRQYGANAARSSTGGSHAVRDPEGLPEDRGQRPAGRCRLRLGDPSGGGIVLDERKPLRGNQRGVELIGE